MHTTSYQKIESFYETYVEPLARDGRGIRVLDIGSKSHLGQVSYKSLFAHEQIEYVGLDLEEGPNVSLVPEDSYLWRELDKESFDFCISGQSFEHNPFFWITMAEIARVLKPEGKAMIVAPGRGPVHRFPVDCWRFYPDAWLALCLYTGLELVESFFEDYRFNRVQGGSVWCDSCVIARKPALADATEAKAFYAALERIVSTLPPERALETGAGASLGACMRSYEDKVKTSSVKALSRRLRPKLMFQRIFHQL